MCLDFFSEETPCGSPPSVSDHSVFAFWVVAYGRFYCIIIIIIIIIIINNLQKRCPRITKRIKIIYVLAIGTYLKPLQ